MIGRRDLETINAAELQMVGAILSFLRIFLEILRLRASIDDTARTAAALGDYDRGAVRQRVTRVKGLRAIDLVYFDHRVALYRTRAKLRLVV